MVSRFQKCLGGCVALLLSCNIAHANKKPVVADVQKLNFSDLSLTHELYRQLYLEKKNAIVETIKRVDQSIKNHEYKGIENEISRVINTPLYRDYGLWLDGNYRLSRALRSYEQKHYVSAVTHAQRGIGRLVQIREESPDSPLFEKLVEPIVELESVIASSFAKRNRSKDSVEYFERVFARIKKEWRMSRILFHVPLTHVLQYVDLCRAKMSESCQYWLDGILDSLPAHSKEFKKLKASLPQNFSASKGLKSYPRAYRWYSAQAEDEAEYMKAIAEYFDGKFRNADEAFEEFLKKYSSSRFKQRALFWRGRTLQRRHKNSEAKEIFDQVIEESPTNYYAILAAKYNGVDLVKKVIPAIPKLKMLDESIKFWEKRAILRAINFVKSGLHEYGQLELEILKTRSTLPNEYLFALASLSNESESYFRSFHFLIELYARKYEELFTPYGIRLSFPLAYQDLIQKHSDQEKVDPILILSLVKQESAFQPHAVSGSNAIGLMQLRLFTAADVDGDVSLIDLRDPNRNIGVGTRYLGSLLRRFDNNIVYALSGYNAGPSRLNRWKKEAKSSWDMAEFVESIPYDETQKYVISIIRNYFWYHYRLTGEGMPNLDYFYGKTKGWEPAKLRDEKNVRNLSVSQLKSNP